MNPSEQLKPFYQLRAGDLAPGTPTHSQQECASATLQSEMEVTSTATRDSAPQLLQSNRAEPDLCRADLSGAALLISNELLSAADPAEREAPRKARQAQAAGHGSYNRYYGYRLAKGEAEDPRLSVRHLVSMFCSQA